MEDFTRPVARGEPQKSTAATDTAVCVLQVLTGCVEEAARVAHPRVVQAMSGLAHHEWTPAITGTAAAIALESAQAHCATAFISEVSIFCLPLSATPGRSHWTMHKVHIEGWVVYD